MLHENDHTFAKHDSYLLHETFIVAHHAYQIAASPLQNLLPHSVVVANVAKVVAIFATIHDFFLRDTT